MARKRTANPNPRKTRTPEHWWDVEFMDVELHTSKAGNLSIRVDYSVEAREWPVSEYFTPDHPERLRAQVVALRWKQEMAEAGHPDQGQVEGEHSRVVRGLAHAIEDRRHRRGNPRSRHSKRRGRNRNH